MPKRSVRDAEVNGKRVLLRVDFNVPMDNGTIVDDSRIRASLPTFQYLLDGGARVIVVSHLGRPKGKPSDEYSLRPVAEHLSVLLRRKVELQASVVGPDIEKRAVDLEPGGIILLENVRFEPGEEKNDPELARQLAALADIYVNDAFGAAHRAHASTVGVAAYLPAYAGFLMQRELDALGQLLATPERPFLAILGGAKVSDKLKVIDQLMRRVDGILLGGGMANTFLLAQGQNVGRSLVEADFVDHARQMIADAKSRGLALLLPTDVVVAESLDDAGVTTSVSSIPATAAIYDIGADAAQRFTGLIGTARTVFWNGPMGVFERPAFAAGTQAVARAVATADAFTVVGGGDSISAVEQLGVGDQITHLSTGGGASLEFLEGDELPGVAALLDA
jgi:phosphoglycerate kinase